ncbi:hypothetical protein TEA_009035 [Camellia sinensis var. sinensis]|uniref:Sulfotransferase n=1 Tax=Camellia sinensis var. sinensis TaxID=542762 RepID=A0A4S4EWD4_CAMSN|nr:hypothetical protein TEA_009035 [Camellia sinensis var. sinensis]
MNRSLHDFASHPLHNIGPHGCFPILDTHNFSDCPLVTLKHFIRLGSLLSQESPDKILFLKYEDLKREPTVYVKRLARFLGRPFTIEEERDDVAQKIIEFCSFENLSNLEINKSGVQQFRTKLAIENTNFFRKGEVGDGKNHLTNEMIERIDHITQQKFNGSGLISGELLK